MANRKFQKWTSINRFATNKGSRAWKNQFKSTTFVFHSFQRGRAYNAVVAGRCYLSRLALIFKINQKREERV